MVFFTASLSFYHIKLQLKALPSADTPRAAQPPAHRLILNAPTQLQLCQLGRLGQRRKGSRAKASHGCPSRILFEALHKLINSVKSQVSILAVYFSSFSISFFKMLTVSWTSRLDFSKAPEPGHLDISHILVGSPIFLINTKVQTPIPGSKACLAGLSCSQDCCRNWEPGVKLCRRMPVKK